VNEIKLLKVTIFFKIQNLSGRTLHNRSLIYKTQPITNTAVKLKTKTLSGKLPSNVVLCSHRIFPSKDFSFVD
jgi:hypothetical protein